MKDSIFKLKYLIIINFIFIAIITIVAKVVGYNLTSLLLTDDGYYLISKNLYEGKSIFPNILGPGIPIVYFIIHIFPESYHPFVRLFISFLFSTGIIIFIYYSLLQYLNKKEIFLGSLFFIFNPIYAQWTIKSCPEIFLGFFLALIIYFLLKTIRTQKLIYFIILCLILFISFLIKPVLLIVPLSLIVYSIFLKDKRFITFSLILFIVGASGFYSYKMNTPKVSRQEREKGIYTYGEHLNISQVLWINYVLKTKQFYKNSIRPYEVYDDLVQYIPKKQLWLYEGNDNQGESLWMDGTRRYVSQYYKENPQGSVIGVDIKFILDYPGLFIQKIIFSPLFFLGISGHGTTLKLLYNFFFIMLGLVSFRKCIIVDNRVELISILVVLIGYSIPYLMLYAYDRYSLPILPWLIVWSGYYIARMYDKFLTNQKVNV